MASCSSEPESVASSDSEKMMLVLLSQLTEENCLPLISLSSVPQVSFLFFFLLFLLSLFIDSLSKKQVCGLVLLLLQHSVEQIRLSLSSLTPSASATPSSLLSGSSDSTSTLLSLSLLSSLLEGPLLSELDPKYRILFSDIESTLKVVNTIHPDDTVGALTEQLIKQIEKLPWYSSQKTVLKHHELEKNIQLPCNEGEKNGKEEEEKAQIQESEDREMLREILKQLRDPMMPVRTMGLVSLRELILKKSPLVERNVPKILGTFMDHLKDDEPFVHDAAISGFLSSFILLLCVCYLSSFA